MSVQVTMLQTRLGEDGNLWLAGETKTATDAFARLLVSSNLATATFQEVPQSALTAAQVQAVQFTGIAAADVATAVGSAIWESRQISDGPDRGARLIWAVPDGATEPTWCWWLWPQSPYEGA